MCRGQMQLMNKEFVTYLLESHPVALAMWAALYVRSADDGSVIVNIGHLRLQHQLNKKAFYACFNLDEMQRIGYIECSRINKTLIRITFLETEKRPKGDRKGIDLQEDKEKNRLSGDRKETERRPKNIPGNGKDLKDSAKKVLTKKGDHQNTENQDINNEKRPKTAQVSTLPVLATDLEPSQDDLRLNKTRRNNYDRAKSWLTHNLRKRMIAIYLKFHARWQLDAQLVIGVEAKVTYNLDGADMTGITLIAYRLHKDLGYESEDDIAKTFDFILTNWESLPPNIRNFRKLSQINHNLPNIFAVITSAAHGNKSHQKTHEYHKRYSDTQGRNWAHLVKGTPNDTGD